MMWRQVPDWPYEVSENGDVRNIRSGRVIMLAPHKSGYLNAQLWLSQKYLTIGAHQLVAAAFLGPKPTPAHEVAHRNGDRHRNHFTNLKWATHLENMRDRDDHGTTAVNRTNGKTKFDDALVGFAKALMRSGDSYDSVSTATGIPVRTLQQYHLGTRRSYIL